MSAPWLPLPYQEKAMQHLVERSYSGLFLKPGMRKTSIMLGAFKILKSVGMLDALLVLAPLRVCYTSWPSEIRKWKEFEKLSIGILHGLNKDQVLKQKHDVYVMNYEGLEWLTTRLNEWKGPLPFDGLVIDESTKIKNTNTQRFKTLRPWLPRFRRRYILTGSPCPNSLLDLFGQCYAMDRGASLGQYITHFRRTYFYQSGFGGYDWTAKPDTPQRIYDILSPRVFYAHDEDYLDLPPLLEKDVVVELPKKALAAYKQMENILRLDFNSGKVTAANTGVASMKCRQLANGGIYLDGAQRTWENLHEAKTDAVLDIIDELSGQPALITYDFLHDLDRLQKALRKYGKQDVPHIGKDGVKPRDLPALIDEWNKGGIPYIIVSPKSLAHGVDGLQHGGRAVIWHSLTYSLEDYEQLIRRLRRSGQEERVTVAHVIADQTVDRAVMSTIRGKDKKQNNFFHALKEYWDEN